MLLTDAIAYLNNKSVKASERFKVLTGFDTHANIKDRGTGYWFNELYESKIIDRIEKAKAAASFGGLWAALSGDNLTNKLKNAYREAITSSDEQTESQEEYIALIADYLEQHKTDPQLSAFQFADPARLVSKRVELSY